MAEPDKSSRKPNTLILGVAGALLVLSGLFLIKLWFQVNDLDARLAQSQQREAELEERILNESQRAAQAQQQSEAAQDRASAAETEAERAERERRQAELERELARERAERATTQSAKDRAEAERSRREYERIRDARLAELERMQQALSRIVETERTPIGMVMQLGEDALEFDFDKATIRPENREILSRISGVLLASHGYRLFVYGYTDDQGPDAYNKQLSERRAEAVRKYLVDAGIPADIIESQGYGESSPRVKGTSQQARQKNRRVEIGVVDTVIDYKNYVRDSDR